MEIFWYVFFTILGLLIGSFLNVCIDRLPQGKSIVRPPSHCDSCNRRLTALDNIPVFSYIKALGRCRYCGARIPRRVLFIEILTGALFAFLFWKYGLTADFGIMALYTCVFLVLLVIDLEHQLILNVIVYPMLPVALLISSLRPDGPGVIYALIGGAAGFALFFLIAVLSRGGMGWGDVKMAGLIGLATGFPQVFLALLIAILLGGIIAVFLLILRIKGRKQAIPFGPFLAIGALIVLYFGQVILDWYWGIIG